MKPPLRAAIIGMGGFAGAHHDALHRLEKEGECKLASACDPFPERFEQEGLRWDLAGRGVKDFDDYRQMLDSCKDELDFVTIPTPIPLHARMHQACIDRSLPCYLEKPPTLFAPELEEMLAVEQRAARKTAVAFNFIVDGPRQDLKDRIRTGEFGRPERVSFLGLWPRPASYFTRSAWAGRLYLHGQPVLDFCMGNAMAHYIHNVLFWCGLQSQYAWEPVVSVRAEMYRAHAIESTDTVFLTGRCANGVEVRIAASHACSGPQRHAESIQCEKATITYITGEEYRIEWKDGRQERHPLDGRDLLLQNFRAYFAYLRRDAPRPPTLLEECRPFVDLCGLAFVAAHEITTVPEAFLKHSPQGVDGDELRSIDGVEQACETLIEHGVFPSGSSVTWGRPGGEAAANDLFRLRDTVEAMREQSQTRAG